MDKVRSFLKEIEAQDYNIYGFEISYNAIKDWYESTFSGTDNLTGEYFSEHFDKYESTSEALEAAKCWFANRGDAEKRELSVMAAAVARVSSLADRATSAAAKAYAAAFVEQLSEIRNLISSQGGTQ